MDAYNGCSWFGRVEGEVKGLNEDEHCGCFCCDNGLGLEGGNSSGMEGSVCVALNHP